MPDEEVFLTSNSRHKHTVSGCLQIIDLQIPRFLHVYIQAVYLYTTEGRSSFLSPE